MKRPFLVVYDYGQGGVWAFLFARSESEIKRKFPELEIVDPPPEWMSKSRMAHLQRTMKFDIDEPRGFLETLARRRQRGDGLRATEA